MTLAPRVLLAVAFGAVWIAGSCLVLFANSEAKSWGYFLWFIGGLLMLAGWAWQRFAKRIVKPSS